MTRGAAWALALGALLCLGFVACEPLADGENRSYMEVLDADARIYVWHHFLSDEECDYIKLKAEKRLSRSGVVDTTTGASVVSDIRTSDSMFFGRAEDTVLESMERRLSEWTLTAPGHGEGLQVLRYRHAQKYDAHWDFFFDEVNQKNGGNRYATVLMYMEAAEEGGETVFPKVPAPGGINPSYSDCAKYNLAVKPKKGDAILFHSMDSTGQLEERSMHGACPVLAGEKWSMTKWIHGKHYDMGGDKYDQEHRAYTQRMEAFKIGRSKVAHEL
ncbi:hypothetical protein FOA52_014583 [Chlamydomonas sp. UWO 241]|nr:hypothetical protein FOA52_014583 [Chlamydomonas sp. UWO 241]